MNVTFPRDLTLAEDLARFDAGLDELVRRARLQAGELALLVQRLEELRRDIKHHLR